MIQPNTVITGDSLTVLRSMDDESVDMVITDPPYGIDYQSGRKEKERRLAKIKNDKAPFIWWIYDAARVVKRGGGVLCFARWDVQQTFMDALRLAGLTVKSVIVWDKTTDEQRKELLEWVKIGVAAAEQLYEGQGRGEEKKKYVLEFLASMGFTVDEEAVNAAIEAAVNQLNGGNLPLE